MIFGLLMLGNPLLSAAMIPVLIGIWVFVRGLMYVADSLAWRRRGSGDWSRYLIVGILLLVLGFLMMVDDRFGLLPVAYLLAFIFLLVGFGSLIVAFGHAPRGQRAPAAGARLSVSVDRIFLFAYPYFRFAIPAGFA